MDIIDRIKAFMAHSGLSSSQLADTCEIPRPTMSQILNGRSKKISNDLIARLHANYPQLSVMWLMFGEGDMLDNSNIRISEPEKTMQSTNIGMQPTDSQISFSEFPFDNSVRDFSSNNFSDNEVSFFDEKFGNDSTVESIHEKSPGANEASINMVSHTDRKTVQDDSVNIVANVDKNSNKTISSIMVFYSDNSYEMFTPSQKK